jgi:hypothetical protein
MRAFAKKPKLIDKHWIAAATYSRHEKVRVEPFDAIELELAALWLPEGPELEPER